MRALFNLNHQRFRQRLNQLLLIFALTGASLSVALSIGNSPRTLGRIATIAWQEDLPENGPFEFIPQKSIPTSAELMIGKFDGYLTESARGKAVIVTPKNQQLGDELANWLKGKGIPQKPQTGMLIKVIGFMMMFLLMGGLNFIAVIGEDKERHQLERLLLSPMSMGKYLVSQWTYACLLLSLPTVGLFLVIQSIAGVELGAPLMVYSGLIALICALGVSFGTMMMSIFKTSDRASMLASAIIILTTIVSGSFGAVGNQHEWLEKTTRIFPQKSLIGLAEQLQFGHNPLTSGYLWHILGMIVIFLTVGRLFLARPQT